MFRNSIFLLFVSLFIGVSCSNAGDSIGSRTVVVLTPDEVGEIVLPPGAFESEVLVTLPPSTTNTPYEVAETEVEKAVEETVKEIRSNEESLEELPSTIASEKAAAVSTTSTTSTTTTTELSLIHI